MGDFIDVGSSGFADSRQSIDRRDALSEHSVRSELGQLGGPETNGQYAVVANSTKGQKVAIKELLN